MPAPLPRVAAPVSAPLREFLIWVAFRPRTEADVMEAWQSHCPRFTIWEDALDAGLIALDALPGPLGSARVRLTLRGRAALDGCPSTLDAVHQDEEVAR